MPGGWDRGKGGGAGTGFSSEIETSILSAIVVVAGMWRGNWLLI